MLLVVFIFIFAIICLFLMSKNFYLLANRDKPDVIGKTTMWSGIFYLLLSVLLFVVGFFMLNNTSTQYIVSFSKLVDPGTVEYQ